ncbi:MAG: polyphosphate kinase 2 [Parvibaculaceae bacterium]|nr:polyphosphate kinase 2 [Parvibaculaceae bacterium]
MGKNDKGKDADGNKEKTSLTGKAGKSGGKKEGERSYKDQLYALQVELVKLQKDTIKNNRKVLVIFEGRDGAGKDGTIKRFTEHLSPRDIRIVALPKPSDRESSQWYFQRYAEHLPAAGEVVFFNRSWYNRAGVERVMGFCNDEEYEEFMEEVPIFEQMLARSEIFIFKYYLDITRHEQEKRLNDRRKDPLKQWKLSPIDAKAIAMWEDYSKARDKMLIRTNSLVAPWTIISANDKKLARLNALADFISRFEYEDKDDKAAVPDRSIVFPFNADRLNDGTIAP